MRVPPWIPPVVIAASGVFAATLLAALPAPRGPVNDFAAVLDDDTKAALVTLIGSAREQTSAEVAVVTVASLDGMTVEEYASKLFAAWGIGKKGVDNGVLLLVAPAERRIRIEVGYGLEPVLPDGLAGAIIRTDVLPRFREGNLARGVLQGTRRVVEIVERNHTLTPAERRTLAASADGRAPALVTIPFFGVFIAIGSLSIGVGLRTKTIFPILFGGLFGGIPFLFTSLVPVFNATPLVLGPLAILMGLAGYLMGGARRGPRGSPGSAASSGWVMGGGSSGPSGGGSSDSSGGDFGGGSSGGGGASGSW